MKPAFSIASTLSELGEMCHVCCVVNGLPAERYGSKAWSPHIIKAVIAATAVTL
jgi:hypothetical protein